MNNINPLFTDALRVVAPPPANDEAIPKCTHRNWRPAAGGALCKCIDCGDCWEAASPEEPTR